MVTAWQKGCVLCMPFAGRKCSLPDDNSMVHCAMELGSEGTTLLLSRLSHEQRVLVDVHLRLIPQRPNTACMAAVLVKEEGRHLEPYSIEWRQGRAASRGPEAGQ